LRNLFLILFFILFTVLANSQCPGIYTLHVTDETCFGYSDGTANIDVIGSSNPYGNVSLLTYCASSPNYYYVPYQPSAIIEEVILNGNNNNINNNTSGLIDIYEDYTASMYADIEEGQTYSVSITLNGLGAPGTTKNYSGGKVFIDFNIDGDFNDLGEEIGVIPYNNINTIGIPEIITFTVPNTGVYGPTRMRVVSQNRNDQNANLIGPCDVPVGFTGYPQFGATEDYSIVLNSPASANIVWSTGQTTDSIFSLSPGNYTVDITDNTGCVSTEYFTINPAIALNLSTSLDQTICHGSTPNSLSASCNVSGSYSWSPQLNLNSYSSQTPSFLSSLSNSIVYTVTFTDNQGCIIDDSVTINVNPIPNATISAFPNPACFGDNIQLTANTSIAVNRYRFQYNNGSGWQNVITINAGGWGTNNIEYYNNILNNTQFRLRVREDWGCTASPWSTIINVPINLISTPLISHN
tara:strand:+ start:1669 stop:3066 length:1398 start_codon:yes stop_codon:yes gene_type:complete